ncbi:MAG: hypothetical protein ACRDQ7_11470 [Haloechinothrix sp.]
MATRDVFSAEELALLRGFPEITRTELIQYFTLTSCSCSVSVVHRGTRSGAPGRVGTRLVSRAST